MTRLIRLIPIVLVLLATILGGCGSSQSYVISSSVPSLGPVGDVASIAVTPSSLSLARGLTEELEVVATYTDGTRHNVSRRVSWSVVPASIATVTEASMVTAQAAGSAQLIATLEGVSGQCDLTVVDEGEITALSVTPTEATVSVAGRQQFRATATFSTGKQSDITEFADWTSTSPALATVSNSNSSAGLAQGRAPGKVTIKALLGTLQAQADLTITGASLSSVTVTPADSRLQPGNNQQFVASGRYSDGTTRDLTSEVAWSSSIPLVAAIAPTGSATALAVGSTQIAAALQGVTGSTTLIVEAATLVSIDVVPANSTLATGSNQQYQANGRYDNGSTVDLTAQVTWASSASNVATVSPAGLVTAVAGGSTTISASLGGISGSTGLTVTGRTLVSITITPATNASVATGTTVSYRATGNFSDGSSGDVTQSVTWSTDDPSLATVSNLAGTRGQVTGLKNGLVRISAAEGSIQATVGARIMLYLYGTDGAGVFGYAIEPTTGALSPVPDSFSSSGCICQLLVDPTNRFLYALDGTEAAILTFDIEAGSGRLLARAGSVAAGFAPERMALSPNGDTLYMSDGAGELLGFTVDNNGSLNPAAADTPVESFFSALTFDPTGRYLYAADLGDNALYGYAVNSASGALTPLAGSPYPAGDGPFGLATSRDGKFVYVANSRDGTISGYAAAADGSLSALGGFPVTVGGQPFNLVGDPLGLFFYALDFDESSVSALALISTTGALTAVPGQPFGFPGNLSSGLAVDPSGRFTYTSFLLDPEINGFAVDRITGALAPLLGSPFPVDEPFEDITTTH